MNTLKTDEPATVDMPETNPTESPKMTRKTIVVTSSGNELEIALIVAPLMPGLQPHPHISEAPAMPVLEIQIM